LNTLLAAFSALSTQKSLKIAEHVLKIMPKDEDKTLYWTHFPIRIKLFI